jgi:50S ribosomal protein L16 3-hydroxylase
MSTPPVVGLQSLLGAMPSEEFLGGYWPARPCVIHGAPERLAGLVDLPELRSVPELLRMACDSLMVQSSTAEGEYVNLRVERSQAASLYACGMTLYLNGVRSVERGLGRCVEQLEADLALAPNLIHPGVLASRRGPGIGMHFDSQEGFIVQVSGRKRWRLAPNRHVQNPHVNYVVGRAIPPELAPLCPDGLPQQMPEDTTDIELQPGSVLFMPRGYWHSTETLEDSVHIDLMMPTLTWYQLLVPRLTGGLHLDDAWRSPAFGAWSDAGPDREQALKHARALVLSLRDRLDRIDLEALLKPPARNG